MLLYKLTAEQKLAFLNLVHDIAVSDKSLHTGEKTIVRELCAEMGVSPLNVASDISENEPAEHFKTRGDRVAVLIELAGIAIIDKSISHGEIDALRNLQGKFGFTNKEINEILRLADIYNLLRQGIRTLGGY